MEHTEGEIEVNGRSIQIKHPAGGFLRIALVDGGDSVSGPNARRLVLCWNSYDELLTACEAIKIRIAFIGWPAELKHEDGKPDWVKEIALLEKAIAIAKGRK